MRAANLLIEVKAKQTDLEAAKSRYFVFPQINYPINILVLFRVAPDTDLAGYPANNFAGYRIPGSSIDETVNIVSNVNYIVLN